MKNLENKINNTMWRVLQLLPNKEYAKTLYEGRGEKAKKIAEDKYNNFTIKKGTIGLYKGIYQVKVRKVTN